MELIVGLPEETLDSFVDGMCQILDLKQHNYIGIYPLTALPNTPFGDKKIGEFFEPVTLRAASKIGMDYKLPEIL